MEEPNHQTFGRLLSSKEVEQKSRLLEMLLQFSVLFEYDEPSDRAIAIVGHAFLDTLLREMLENFLIDDSKEVRKLTGPNGALGTFGSKVTACYCLGLIGETILSDLRLVAKVRNQFAHELGADFSDERIKSWCRALRWHKEALMEPPAGVTARDLFQVGVNQLVCHLDGLVVLARHYKREKSKSGSRSDAT